MDLSHTRHGDARSQQRALPPLAQSLLLDHGSRMRRHGADVVFLDKAARKRLRHAVGGDRGLHMLEPWLNSYVVVSDDGRIITAARRTRRLRRQ